MAIAHRTIQSIANHLLSKQQRNKLKTLAWRDGGHGYDRLGMHPDWIAAALGISRFLYEVYFRVESHDSHHLPSAGPAVLAANHSGTLPLDAVMLYCDVARNTRPPRVPRIAFDRFVPRLPWLSTAFARAGAVSGTRPVFRSLLRDGELVGVFPEGAPGIGKPFRDRYQLQTWRVGHAELAIRHRAPVVPVAIIGAEEQWPQLTRLNVRLFGAPFLPIPATPLPLPTRYHIWYGAPLWLHEQYAPDRADDPDVCAAAAAQVKRAVQELIARGLAERTGVFV